MTGSLQLHEYPADLVRLSCAKCGRAGQYRKQNLIERHGADIRLPDLREEIAQCDRAGKMHDACMVHYVDLKPKQKSRRGVCGSSCAFSGGRAMDDAQVGWIAVIIFGGVAGWLAEHFMKSEMGLLMNIVLGIVGAAVASAILSAFGVRLGGWIGYLIAGFIGGVLLIWIVRVVRGRA